MSDNRVEKLAREIREIRRDHLGHAADQRVAEFILTCYQVSDINADFSRPLTCGNVPTERDNSRLLDPDAPDVLDRITGAINITQAAGLFQADSLARAVLSALKANG